MNMDRAYTSIRNHEGLMLKPYKDSKGFWTIGIGELIHTRTMSFHEAQHLLENGITEDAAVERCRHKIRSAELSAREIVGPEVYDQLNEVRQEVLVEMVYQMGATGLARFTHTLEFIRDGLYEEAAAEMLDSKWHREDSPIRARTLSDRFRKGMYT